MGAIYILGYTCPCLIEWIFPMDLSMSCWMDTWFTDFWYICCYKSPSVSQYVTHTCGISWFWSRCSLILSLFLALICFLFLSISLFSVTQVNLGHKSHDEVSKSSENRLLIWFSQEIPSHFTRGTPSHWHFAFANPICYKRYLLLMCLVRLLIKVFPLFSIRIALLFSW